MNRRPVFLMTVLCFGFAFFYFPILSMMVHSCNGSRRATVWGGFSTTWYVSLMSNKQVGAALVLSLKIALTSATAATILGRLAGITLARLILLAQWIGWPGRRGFTRVTLAHIRFSLVDRTTVIHARLIQSDHAIKEAAMDLGSRPWQVLFDVTLPVIFPAILSGWLLAFTISLDDVVITSFTTGPGSTTLPLLIWSKVKLGVTPDNNALATLSVLVVGIYVRTAIVDKSR